MGARNAPLFPGVEMADDIEIAEAAHDTIVEAEIQTIRNRAANIPVGTEGECFFCGEYYKRLVNTVCARCRDARGLP